MTDITTTPDAADPDRRQGDGQRRPDQGSDVSPAPAQTDTGPATGGDGAGGSGGSGGFGT